MRPEKQLLLDEIQTQIEESTALVVFNYLGLGANTLAEFRDEMAKNGSGLEMVRKRLFQRAAEKAGLSFERADLPGHVGLLLGGEDPVAATKALLQLGKDTGAINVLGGRFDGVTCTASDIQKISKLPSLQELRGQLLGLFEAPMAQTMSVMQALLSSVVYCLDNKIKTAGES